jgi:conjugal transfer/entry exclusion protein
MKLEDDLLKVIEESATSLDELNQDVDKLEKECLLRKKVLEMMPSAADNIAKLESICEKASEKLKALEKEWQSVEDPLLKEIAIKENLKIERMNRVSEMIEDIKKYRELMGPMLHDLKERQERAQLLSEERAKLPKNLNRTLYTHRIMDITASLAKQHKEVEKITNDIRDLQKTINLNSNTLQRTDAICEELIFKAASDRNDPVMVDTYRRLKTLRAAFETLIATVNTIGSTEKQTRDFETKIDQEKNRLASYNFDRIQGDLDAIMKENQSLVAQVKQLSK